MKTKKIKSKFKKITKDTNLAKLLWEHPETAEILVDYGLHCIGCAASSYDTLEAGCKVHGLDDETISELVDRINEVIEFKE
jgi:hybrid cluster-associated redox disulfide protein